MPKKTYTVRAYEGFNYVEAQFECRYRRKRALAMYDALLEMGGWDSVLFGTADVVSGGWDTVEKTNSENIFELDIPERT